VTVDARITPGTMTIGDKYGKIKNGGTMKILGICCSPRLHGNTEIMLQGSLKAAQEEGAEVELITVAGKNISFCDGCFSCRKAGKCHIKDDMQDIYTKLLEADGIIFGSPVYLWSLSAQAKAVIDRTVGLPAGPGLRNKAAGVLATAERSGGATTIAAFIRFFTLQKMIMVGWAIGISGSEGFTDKESVKKDQRGLGQAEALGKAMVKYLQSHEL